MDDLFKALQMFKEGVQGAATLSAVNDATSAMGQIQTATLDDAQKRQQLQQLSNQTALRLTGLGASGTQIQSAFNAIAPQNFGSAEQLQLEGALSGNQQYTQQAENIIGARDKKATDAETRAFQRKLFLQDREAALALGIENAKQGGKFMAIPGFELAPGVKPTEKDVEALKTGSESYLNINSALSKLDSMVSKYGTEAVTVPMFGGADKKQMTQLKTSMVLQLKEMEKLGALAGPDVEVLENMMPDPTAYRTNQYVEASKTFKQELQNRIKNRALSRGARFVGFGAEGQAPGGGDSIQVRTLKDGSRVKVRQLPDGSFEQVD